MVPADAAPADALLQMQDEGRHPRHGAGSQEKACTDMPRTVRAGRAGGSEQYKERSDRGDRKLKSQGEASTDMVMVGNEHEEQSTGLHKWTVFVRGVDGSHHGLNIEYVVFKIHQDFSPSVITVREPPFEITKEGWGMFEVDITLHFPDGAQQQLVWGLDFTASGSHHSMPILPERCTSSHARLSAPAPTPKSGAVAEEYLERNPKSKSGFAGVYMQNASRWEACVTIPCDTSPTKLKKLAIGRYSSALLAARARKEWLDTNKAHCKVTSLQTSPYAS